MLKTVSVSTEFQTSFKAKSHRQEIGADLQGKSSREMGPFCIELVWAIFLIAVIK